MDSGISNLVTNVFVTKPAAAFCAQNFNEIHAELEIV
jgi:hypothetical protein